MTPPLTLTIGGRVIGDGQPAFVIAEIGYNFTTPQEALDTMTAAVDAGADAVKFQTFRAETLVSRRADFPDAAGGGSQFEEFERFEISEELHARIAEHARELGTIWLSTPSHYNDVALLERLAVPAHKIGSDDLTNLPFIEFIARTGKPVIMSTGMATMAEVTQAVEAFRAGGNTQLVLLHCVSAYPVTDLADMNLRAMQSLRRAFGVPTGLSDHTTSSVVPVAAVAMGACVLERHFTLRKDFAVPDAAFSTEPSEFRALVKHVRDVEAALGDGTKQPRPVETAMRRDTRKSVIARCDIPKDAVITTDMVIVKRPNWGVPPSELHMVIGRKARRAIAADEPITWDLV